MKFSQHAKGGVIAATLTAASQFAIVNDWKMAGLSGVLCFIGSIFPDLDTESIPSRWAARLGLVFSLICFYTKNYLPAVIAGSLFFLIKSGSHRGFTHKYFFPAICIGVGIGVGNFLHVSFGVGLIVHFWLDRISIFEWKNWF